MKIIIINKIILISNQNKIIILNSKDLIIIIKNHKIQIFDQFSKKQQNLNYIIDIT